MLKYSREWECIWLWISKNVWKKWIDISLSSSLRTYDLYYFWLLVDWLGIVVFWLISIANFSYFMIIYFSVVPTSCYINKITIFSFHINISTFNMTWFFNHFYMDIFSLLGRITQNSTQNCSLNSTNMLPKW